MATAGIRDELSCSICRGIYTDPVTLPCGHTFCRGCIERTWDWQKSIEEDPSCPECRQRYRRQPELKRNLRLKNIVERFLSTPPEHDGTGIYCTYCIHSPVLAAKSCLLCEASLCDGHVRVHSKSAEHVLTEPTANLGNRKCSAHNEPLKYHCCEDGAPICASCCLAGGHRGHRVELLSEASEKKKEKLRKVLEKLSPEREETERQVQSVQKFRTEVQEIEDAVITCFAEIREILTNTEDYLQEKEKKYYLKFCPQIRELEIKKDELSRKIRHIEELCNMADPLTVLQEQWESHGAAFCGAEGAGTEGREGTEGADTEGREREGTEGANTEGIEGEDTEGEDNEGIEGEDTEGEDTEGREREGTEGANTEGIEGEDTEGEDNEGREREDTEGEDTEGREGEDTEGEDTEGREREGTEGGDYEGREREGTEGGDYEGREREGTEGADTEGIEGDDTEGADTEGKEGEGTEGADTEGIEGEDTEGEDNEGGNLYDYSEKDLNFSLNKLEKHISYVRHQLPWDLLQELTFIVTGREEWWICAQEATDLVLDTDTASNIVDVSEDSRTVSYAPKTQRRPQTPQRFQWIPQALSTRSFPSGHHYWDVEVSESGNWKLGVAYPSIERRGKQSCIGGNDKSWCLCRGNNIYTTRHDGEENNLLHIPSVPWFRILLDYEAGSLSFYELSEPIRHLHTFSASFTEPLHAAFWVWGDKTWVTIIS
uniref:Uncharacterized protein n=1 Tax=Xenopus tropicalis TaxID=8364 RepID=A0A1B8XXH2_XENTR